ncbi:hypothetical protein TNCV_795961 [Trichonephila clavipes]|nr:hypothetical protein TNCV_795961 [Trichonephila clavipes]
MNLKTELNVKSEYIPHFSGDQRNFLADHPFGDLWSKVQQKIGKEINIQINVHIVKNQKKEASDHDFVEAIVCLCLSGQGLAARPRHHVTSRTGGSDFVKSQ